MSQEQPWIGQETTSGRASVPGAAIVPPSSEGTSSLAEEIGRLRLENDRLKACLREARETLELPLIRHAWQL